MHASTLHRLFPSAKFDEPLKRYTAWKIGGPADALLEPTDAEELIEATEKAREHDVPVTMLGGGTNVLVRDGGIRGLTIRLAKSLTDVRSKGCTVTADAGVLYPVLANTTAGRGLDRPGVRYRHPRHRRRRSLHERRRLRLRDDRSTRLGRRLQDTKVVRMTNTRDVATSPTATAPCTSTRTGSSCGPATRSNPGDPRRAEGPHKGVQGAAHERLPEQAELRLHLQASPRETSPAAS